MRQFLNGQYNHLKGFFAAGRPGANPAGMKTAAFEQFNDAVWDSVLGPGMRIAGRAALIGGIGYAGYWASNNIANDTAGGLAAGGIIGGLALGTIGSWAGNIKAQGVVGNGVKDAAVRALWRFGTPTAGALAGVTLGAVAGGLAASIGGWPTLGVLGGAAVYNLAVNKAGGSLLTPLNAAVKAMGGGGGLLNAAVNVAKTGAYTAYTAGRGLEFGARAFLTMGKSGMQDPLDAWFPFFRNTPITTISSDFPDPVIKSRLTARGVPDAKAAETATVKAGSKIIDPRKYAPNPRIVRRMVGTAALFSIGSAFKEAMSPMIAPPTAFFDGRNMRHINDLGTGGAYGMGVMGRNSSLNMNHQDAARVIAAAF